MHYQTRITKVFALKWDGSPECTEKILTWAGPVVQMGVNKLMVYTPEDRVFADIGDYIVRDEKDNFYPMKPDVFEAKHEAIP